MQLEYYPLIIIGSGVAGLSAAIQASELGIKALVISKEDHPCAGNSRYAQGGIIFADPDDQTLTSDFLRASSQTCNQEMVDLIRLESPTILKRFLLQLAKIPFEADESGALRMTKEGAHSHPRILFKGDYSGRAIVEGMLHYLEENCPNITFLNSYRAFELIVDQGKVVGVHLCNQEGNKTLSLSSSSILLATGGCAGLYQNTSNYPGALGEGIGMGLAAGATARDLEFIQFHPTTLYLKDSHLRFLISEAVRGEGALLRNCRGERFMPRYHPDAELASRDIVSLSIVEEMRQTAHPCVYLDISHFSDDHFAKRFPTIASKLEQYSINYRELGIPVVPSAHFTCGGLVTDLWGKCSGVQGLYAAGEVACTGLHGANRLASSALLEGLMMGARAVIAFNKQGEKNLDQAVFNYSWNLETSISSDNFVELSALLWQQVGIERTESQMVSALSLIEKWKTQVAYDQSPAARIWYNSLLTAEQIAMQSLARTKSIGCFNRR